MTKEQRDHLIPLLTDPELSKVCRYTLEADDRYPKHDDNHTLKWSLSLIPVDGFIYHIDRITRVVNDTYSSIIMFCTTENGGCIKLL